MPTITKKGRGKGQVLPVISTREADDLRGKIEADQQLIAEATGKVVDEDIPEARLSAADEGRFDVGAAQKRLERNKRTLSTLDPMARRLTGAERQKAERRYADLSEILPKTMMTKEEQNYFPSSADHNKDQSYQKAVKKAMAKGGEFDPSWISMAQEWKNLGRLLWPEEPGKSNLENIRPSGGVSGRHFRS